MFIVHIGKISGKKFQLKLLYFRKDGFFLHFFAKKKSIANLFLVNEQ